MKKNEVKIDGYYVAKISDKLTTVHIVEENPHGGWTAVNTKTGKRVRIVSPAKLRGEATADGQAKKPGKRSTVKATKTNPVAPVETAEPEATTDTTETKAIDTAHEGEPKEKRLGLLSAAVKVLEEMREDDDPLNCHQLVERATAAGYWTPRAGKTPANTLYAAILREINEKGEASRFVKVERGKFRIKTQS